MHTRYTTLEILHGARLPINRENYIKVKYWYLEEISSFWNPKLEAELPEDLQDWSVFEGSEVTAQENSRG